MKNKLIKTFIGLPKLSITYIIVYAISLSGALYNHTHDLIFAGFLPYYDYPFWVNCYWTSLTFIEPFSILFLFIKPRIGIILCIFIIVTDVFINGSITILFNGFKGLLNFFFVCQFRFFLFVLATSSYILKSIKNSNQKAD